MHSDSVELAEAAAAPVQILLHTHSQNVVVVSLATDFFVSLLFCVISFSFICRRELVGRLQTRDREKKRDDRLNET